MVCGFVVVEFNHFHRRRKKTAKDHEKKAKIGPKKQKNQGFPRMEPFDTMS